MRRAARFGARRAASRRRACGHITDVALDQRPAAVVERHQIDFAVPLAAVGSPIAPFACAKTPGPARFLSRSRSAASEAAPSYWVGGDSSAMVLPVAASRLVNPWTGAARIAVEDASFVRIKNEQGKTGVDIAHRFRRFACKCASVLAVSGEAGKLSDTPSAPRRKTVDGAPDLPTGAVRRPRGRNRQGAFHEAGTAPDPAGRPLLQEASV